MQSGLVNAAINEILAYTCGPTLAHIKPASLITIPLGAFAGDVDEVLTAYNDLFAKREICFRSMKQREENVLVLVYCPELLNQALAVPAIKHYLEHFGYRVNAAMEDLLQHLEKRLAEESFPHETGLFLGYPLEDVVGFVHNKGRNYKLCGYWKVYGNEIIARQVFLAYNFCQRFFVKYFQAGVPVEQITLGAA